MQIQANLVDIHQRRIFHGMVEVAGGIIRSIQPADGRSNDYLLPGFVDAHVHVESSMLVPSEFARLAVIHGTVATVSDPHEIANVLGIEGVNYMIDNGRQVPFKFGFGAPSCVPATQFETAGAKIGVDGIRELLRQPEVGYLAEVMNYPDVIAGDPDVIAKLQVAKEFGLPIDGHAPRVRGSDIEEYVAAGISTDHECFSSDEAFEKLRLGMKILIREGSAAKNFDALIDLLPEHFRMMMFCSDDKHPNDLIQGHINQLVARAIARGCELFDVLQVACVNPVEHYQLPVGMLREGDPADFILTSELTDFAVKETYIDGQLVAAEGATKIRAVPAQTPNRFDIEPLEESDFSFRSEARQDSQIRVIKAIDGEIITECLSTNPKVIEGDIVTDIDRDLLKIAVVNRYQSAPIALAMIHGFHLQRGAIASCVAHDSHNIIAVGCDDGSICQAVNLIIENRGGISAASGTHHNALPLPVAGIMTNADGFETAKLYEEIDEFAKVKLGTTLSAPFMTLSFMALLVIPSLKLGDQGLFDGDKFAFTDFMDS